MSTSESGRGGGFDPADQWVLNPDTGEYELRPAPTAEQPAALAEQPAVPAPRSAPDATGRPGVPGPRRAAGRTGARARAQRKVGKRSTGKRILLWTTGTLAFVVVAGAPGI
ncbi:hypothetical protein [Streptomyces sp. NPDC054783]